MEQDQINGSNRSLEYFNGLHKKTNTDPLFVNFNCVPSLMSMARMAFAIRLWWEPFIDIQLYFKGDLYNQCGKVNDVYKKYEGRVFQNLKKTSLPNLMKKQLAQIIKPVGLELMSCFCIERHNHCGARDIYWFKLDTIYWTHNGTIDHIKSLKELIKKQKRYVGSLYELACKYCLEDDIAELWEKLTSTAMESFGCYRKEYEHHFVAYWTAVQNKESMSSLMLYFESVDEENVYNNNVSIYQNMVSLALHVKNPYAFKYFWHKLRYEQIVIDLKPWFGLVVAKLRRPRVDLVFYKYNAHVDIFCFLLSQLEDGSKQHEILQTHANFIFKPLYYHWPNQDFFFPILTVILPYLSESVCVETLSDIVWCGEGAWFDVFQEVWISTTDEVKKHFITSLERYDGSLAALSSKSAEEMKMVLDCASESEKKQILFSQVKKCQSLYNLNSNSLDSLMTMFLTNPNDVNEFKELVMSKYAKNYCYSKICAGDIQAVEMLLNWGFKSVDEIKLFKKNFNEVKAYVDLVCSGNKENIDKFLNWYFETSVRISKFKRTYTGKITTRRCKRLLRELKSIGKYLKTFSNFIDYSFISAEEVEHFKKLCLKKECYEYFEIITGRASVHFSRFLLNWCLGSNKKVAQFKKEHLFSQETVVLFIKRVKDKSWFKVEHLLKLCSPIPSKEAARFKNLIREHLIEDEIALARVYEAIDKFTK